MRKRFWLYSFIILAFSISMVVALDCDTVPTCADLGFTMSVDDCTGREILRCPRDPNNDKAVYCGEVCLEGKLAFHPLWDGRGNTKRIVETMYARGNGYGSNSGRDSHEVLMTPYNFCHRVENGEIDPYTASLDEGNFAMITQNCISAGSGHYCKAGFQIWLRISMLRLSSRYIRRIL